jgi:hypothetical protein
MDNDLASVFGMWGLFAAVAWIVWVVTSNRRRQAIAQTQADMQAKLLDKLSTSQDLAEFLKSDQGQHLLDSASTEPADPHSRILASIQAGLVLTLLGLSMLVVSRTLSEAQEGMTVFGTMAAAVGIGFLVSSAVSYMLSRSWGLFDRRNAAPR